MPDINSDSSVGLRRYSNNLVNAGHGYILFGFWAVVKLFMMMTMQQDFMQKTLENVGPTELSEKAVRLFTVITMVILGLIVLYIHIHIGRGAVRYGRGTSRKRGFIFWGAVVSIIMIIDIPLYFEGDMLQPYSSTVASIIVDMTEVGVFVDMMYSTHMMKRLRNTQGGETADAG